MVFDPSLETIQLLDETLETAQTIPFSDNKTEVILSIIRLDGLDSSFLAEVAEFTTRNIGNSGDRERVLKRIIDYK